MERTGPQVNVAPTRCPYCHEGIPRGEQPAVCPGCHALHHVACLDEAGACASCGRRTGSPEDSKLTAALRARASARVVAKVEVGDADQPPRRRERPWRMFRPATVPVVVIAVIWAILGDLTVWGVLFAAVFGVFVAGLVEEIAPSRRE